MLNINSGRRDLVITVSGRAVSIFGDAVALVALTLRVVDNGAQPYQVALLLAAGGIPLLLLANLAGRLVDAHDSRLLLVTAGCIETACTVPLIVVHSVVAIALLIIVLGAAAAVSGATWTALLPRVAGDDQVAKAISTQQSLNALVLVGAPAVGGVLVGAFGTRIPLAIDAFSFLVETLAAASVRARRSPQPAAGGDQPADVRSGFAILRGDRVLAPLMVGVALVILLVGMVDVVLVFLVRQTLHAGGAWFGVSEATWMAGMVGGAVAAGALRSDNARVRATVVGAGLACAALVPYAVVPAVWMLLPLSVLGGLGNGYAGTAVSTLLVGRVPDAQRGRVSAAATATLGGAQGLSLLAGGLIASALSPRAVCALAGLLGVAAAIVLGFLTLPQQAEGAPDAGGARGARRSPPPALNEPIDVGSTGHPAATEESPHAIIEAAPGRR